LENWKIYDAGCEIIPDEPKQIQERARHWSQQGCNLVLFAGGTGLSPRDRTPEALIPIMDRLVPGIMEAARNYGQDRTPYAMLSRGVAGFIGHTLVLALPGSVRGAEECLDAIFPQVLHLFFVAEGKGHAR
jgi:molybdenum cofactor synthesis domain-containing protein